MSRHFCAGHRRQQATRIGVRDCRHHILGQAARERTALAAYRRAAAFLAGDADEPQDQSAVEKLVLALSREQGLFEEELGGRLGLEAADELVFSQTLCFTEATHELARGEQNSTDGN